MTRIRVDPANLRQAAQQLSGIADRLRALGSEAHQATFRAPSYEGQFGPKARAMGMEAEARLRAQADRFTALSEELESRAAAFEAVDQETQVSFDRLSKMIRMFLEDASLILKPSKIQPPWLINILSALTTPAPTATPTPTPTTTPSSQAPNASIYWGGLNEAQLAELQQYQGQNNDCGEYSIAAALNILYGSNIQGCDVAAAADQVWWPLPWTGLRMWPDGPTTPKQQANIANGIARQGGLSLSATAIKGTTADLVQLLEEPNTAVILTIGWDNTNVPQIARNSVDGSEARGGGFLGINAHAMLLVAYDPSHMDGGNPPKSAPWGFVNSWVDGSDPNTPKEIYWMPEADLNQAWDHSILGVGSNNMVVITKDPPPTETPVPIEVPTPTVARTPTPTPTMNSTNASTSTSDTSDP